MSRIHSYSQGDTENILMGRGDAERVDMSEKKEIEITPAHAYEIFENKVVNNINERLEQAGGEIILPDETVKLDWVVDEEMPRGSFAIIKSGINVERSEQPKEYISVTDQITGDVYREEKLPENFKPHEKMHRFYYLDTAVVKGIFNKLDPEVKKSLLDAWKENLIASKGLLLKFREELNNRENSMSVKEKNDLGAKILEEEVAVSKITKLLEALA